jgi:hypothetical protein
MNMDITELQAIEEELSVEFVFKPARNTIAARGTDEAVTAALTRIASDRPEVMRLLRERQGLPDVAMVEREISTKAVPSKAIQRSNYRLWYAQKNKYYQPTPEQEETMWAAIEEGDVVHFDFAHSVTCEKPSGLLVQVDRKGRIGAPSDYSPVVRAKAAHNEAPA